MLTTIWAKLFPYAGDTAAWHRYRRIVQGTILIFVAIFLFNIVWGMITDGKILGEQFAGDAHIYSDGSHDLINEKPIYWIDIPWKNQNPPYYSPEFFALLAVMLVVGEAIFVRLWVIAVLVAYWHTLHLGSILVRQVRPSHWEQFIWLFLPLAVLNGDAHANIYLANIAPFLWWVMLAGYLAVERQSAIPTGLCMTAILITKPQYAVFMGIPLLVALFDAQARNFVLRAAAVSIASFLALFVLGVLLTSPDYMLDMSRDQIAFISETSENYPYRESFETTNGGIAQQFYRVGLDDYAQTGSLIIQVLVTLGFIAFAWRYLPLIVAQQRRDLLLLMAIAGTVVALVWVVALNDLIFGAFVWALLVTYFKPARGLQWMMIAFIFWQPLYFLYLLGYIPYIPIQMAVFLIVIGRIIITEVSPIDERQSVAI